MKKTVALSFKKFVVSQLKISANTTTSGYLYQQKAPEELKKFSSVK